MSRTEYRKYRRSQIAELADWEPGFDMTGVSVSDADKAAGSPKVGDKIARNPVNHADRWLVAADYFAANFEAALLREPSGAQPVAWDLPDIDRGPWKVLTAEAGLRIYSDDFTYDAMISLDGDFGSKARKQEYADWLAAKLNAAPAPSALPEGWAAFSKPRFGYFDADGRFVALPDSWSGEPTPTTPRWVGGDHDAELLRAAWLAALPTRKGE